MNPGSHVSHREVGGFPRSAPLGFLMALAAAFLALATLPGAAAHAAGPAFLKALPKSEVVIPVDQSSGTFKLAWDTGNGQPGDLYVSTNNGPQFGPQPVGPTSGPQPPSVAINLGDVQVWKLYSPGRGRLLAPPLTVTAVHPDQSCLRECIQRLTVDPHGTFADFHVATTHKVSLKLETHEQGTSTTVDQKSTSGTDDWKTTMDNLQPNTTYEYTLTAIDDANDIKYSTGTFHTLHRHVQVTFESITAIDDSDSGSPGDLTFWFKGNGVWDLVNTYGEVSIATGDTAHPNHVANFVDTPKTFTIAVYGDDDDCDFGQFCTEGIGPLGEGGGSSDEQDWATAWGSIDASASGPNEAFSGTTDFFTVGWSLEFSVHASFVVSYT
jgi:hypothetical protein